MPRPVPTEIVRTIDRYFPWAGQQERTEKPSVDQIGGISAIVSLVDRLPEERLVLAPDAYADFIAGLEDLCAQKHLALARGSSYVGSGEPVRALRRLLVSCPDEGVITATHELSFVRSKQLRESLRLDVSEANQSLNEGRWKAATVLAGSIIEALLVWRLSKLTKTERQAAISAVTLKPGQKAPTGPVYDWLMWALIGVAA